MPVQGPITIPTSVFGKPVTPGNETCPCGGPSAVATITRNAATTTRHIGMCAAHLPPSPGKPNRVQVTGDLWHGEVPTGAVYIGRPAPGLPGSRYRNHFRVGKPTRCAVNGWDVVPTTREASIGLYRDDLRRKVANDPGWVEQARWDLAGRDLACWCETSVPCHGDLLLALVNTGTGL